MDTACVGSSTPAVLTLAGMVPLLMTATGHGSRQKCNVNDIGFPCSKPKGAKQVKGFHTGDLVRATVTTGTKRGSYVGRVLVRASGSFDLRTKGCRVQGISHRCARRFIAAMVTATRSERGMGRQTPPRSPQKERAIPPPAEARGHPRAVSVIVRFPAKMSKANCHCIG